MVVGLVGLFGFGAKFELLHSAAGYKLDQIQPQPNLAWYPLAPYLLLLALELLCIVYVLHLQHQLHGCGCPVQPPGKCSDFA